MPSGLLDRLQRILPLANQVADEIVYEKPEILEKTISRMFEVMYRVAKFSCDYVKNGRWSCHLWLSPALTVVARTKGGSTFLETIEEMDKELTKVIEDFMRAVDVETLRLARRTGTHSPSWPRDSSCLGASCRASGARESRTRSFAQTTQTDRDQLSPRPLLYGRYPPISPQ